MFQVGKSVVFLQLLLLAVVAGRRCGPPVVALLGFRVRV